MRASLAMVVVLLALVTAVPAAAQEAEALRKELEQMRRQFEAVQQEYRRNLDQLTERLQRLESRPSPAGVPAAPPGVAPPAAPAVAAPPTGAAPTLLDLARPRQPFALGERRGGGALLFDIGIAGDFVANITQRSVDEANAGTFAGRENRLFPREIELSLFGQVDPYAQAVVRIEAAEEFEDGAREIHVGLAEAYLTLLTLPWGTQARLGLMRARFGLLNERHQHDLPQIDRPHVLVRFFGEEQLVESGVEASWVAPLPFFLEAVLGVFNGDNEEAFGRGSLKAPLVTGRLRTFFEPGDTSALQLGVSVGSGETDADRRSNVFGADLKYKLTPDGWRHGLLTIAAEALYGSRAADVLDDAGLREDRRRERFGWYAYAEVQPWQRWSFGARVDSTQDPVEPGREWAVQPYVSFMPSEFLRFRLGYKHTERSHRLAAEAGSAGIVDELLFQATFFLGAHPAHAF
jgi:hypothetical protein